MLYNVICSNFLNKLQFENTFKTFLSTLFIAFWVHIYISSSTQIGTLDLL